MYFFLFRIKANSSLSNADSIESLVAKNDDIEFMNTLKEDLEHELNSKSGENNSLSAIKLIF